MSRLAPVVPPLSKPAWQRVETRLLERLGRGEHLVPANTPKPARPWLHALPAVAMALAAVIWWQREANVSLTADASPAAVMTPLPNTPPAPRRTSHFETTSEPTRATLGEATVTLATQSEMSVVGSDDAGWHVNVERGQVEFDVAPRRGRPPFVVQAGETLVTVVGTRFSVVRDGPRARVRVLHGRVQVDSGAHRGSLGPGEQWPAPATISPPQALLEVVKVTQLAAQKDRGRGRPRPDHGARARESFATATRLESKNPRAAIALYRQLARGKGPWAANALYAEARLELERGHEATARKRLERYLRSFPDGKNASDVRSTLQRLAAGRGAH